MTSHSITEKPGQLPAESTGTHKGNALFPVNAVRADFPILSRMADWGEKPYQDTVAYLDNAATTQKPLAVMEAVHRIDTFSNANVHRSLSTMGEETTREYELARERVRRFIGASSTCEIVFTSGATAAINLIAMAYRERLCKGPAEILLTEMEHHSNLVPWQMAAAATGAKLRFIPVRPDGTLAMDELPRLWNKNIKLVSLCHVSNVLGTINPIGEVVAFAHEQGVPVVVDGAQAVAHLPVDVAELDADFYVFSGHKMVAPTGIGVLYGRESLLRELPPVMGGGDMISAVWLERSNWNDLPYRFEAGTPNYTGAVGLGSAVEYLEGLGRQNIRSYEAFLTRHALLMLREVPGIGLYGNAPNRCGVISFNLSGVHSHDLAQFVDSRGIAIRAGHHCAQPLFRKLKIKTAARASLCFYNTVQEIDRLVRAVREAREYFQHGTG